MATLHIVGTPIGNLEDISLRALRILGEVDYLLCEDTRNTKKLLDRYKIKTPTISYHEHSSQNKIDYIIDLLAGGKNLALVSDAGTPGISDPGGKLVRAVINKLGAGALGRSPVQIESVPGPSAITAALSISGIPTDKFIFLGFLPHKKGRQTFLRRIVDSEFPVVVYESKHRIIKFLEELNEMSAKLLEERKDDDQITNYELRITNKNSIPSTWDKFQKFKEKTKAEKHRAIQSVVVCRELSKMHETVYRGDIKSIIEKIKQSPEEQKGEFVVIIGK